MSGGAQSLGGVAHAAPGKPHPLNEQTGIRLAITVDDLPGGGPVVAGHTHPRIVADIIATLRAHHVRWATGFVVGSMLEHHPERRASLNRWVDAGFDVGNHTYSHRALSEIGLEAYLKDIEADEQIVDELQGRTGQTQRFFRYPYLEEGRTEEERKALGEFLAEHRYTVAKVSVDFEDWAWADARDRCVERGDGHALDRLEQNYLANAGATLGWALVAARQVYGRTIPQVLLLHANASTAHNLDALLTAFEKQGVRYIPLGEALADPAYADDYRIADGNIFRRPDRAPDHLAPPLLPPPFDALDLACRGTVATSQLRPKRGDGESRAARRYRQQGHAPLPPVGRSPPGPTHPRGSPSSQLL